MGRKPEPLSEPDQDTLWSDRLLSRRGMLGRAGLAAGALCVGGVLDACGSSNSTAGHGSGSVSKSPGAVSMLGWQGYDDAHARKPFEAAGGTLQTTYISNNDEILTKLRAGQGSIYSVVTPSAGYLPALVAAGVIQPLDYSRLPAAAGYFSFFHKPKWNTFGGQTWGAPIQWGDAPMCYRPDLLHQVPDSWFQLADPQYKNLVAMWDDATSHILVMAHALKYPNPSRLTISQLATCQQWLTRIRQNSRTVAPTLGDLASILASGDALLTTESWEGVAMFVRSKGKPCNWKTPKEGSWGWNDQYVIPKGAPNVDGAYAFINTMIGARSNAYISNDTTSGTPVQGAVPYLNSTAKGIFDYSNLAATVEGLGFYPLPPLQRESNITSYEDWLTAWQQVKG
jgi:spermidine/putrescine transport system substrate-binding protein